MINRPSVFRIFIPFIIFSFSANLLAEESSELPNESKLIIDRMLATKDAIFIGFTSQPEGCVSNYNGYHAVFERVDSSFDQKFLQLRSARNSKKEIAIEYEKAADCSKSAGKESLLTITALTL